VVSSLHQRVAAQSQSADRTRQAIQAIEEKMLQVSQAMEQVASNTQEVSSAILQMQASVEEIARNSEVLTRSVETTVSSTNEIASTAEEIKGSTDNLHVAGQEAVSFLTELDASLEETRRNARQLSETSTRVTRDAEGGFSSVAAVEEQILRTHAASEQSRKALGDLTSAIEKIGRIVNVIQDVTEQTNLLSLNASIIAAGAGEYGKAFAVVATQIRELSARTAANTKEIRSIIGDLTASGSEMAAAMDKSFQVVESSTDLSRRAGESLRTILESASVQEEMSKRIAAATEELAHGGQSANRAMQEIFEMIEGISRAAKEQAASTRYLTDESERVREVASQLGNATIEQAKGSRVISEAITRIMEDTAGTNAAVQDQTEEAKAVYEAMRAVAASAQAIEEAFGDLTNAASHLQQSAVTLKREIQIFRTS
jgi:methyl-accepting chemotaxis protein